MTSPRHKQPQQPAGGRPPRLVLAATSAAVVAAAVAAVAVGAHGSVEQVRAAGAAATPVTAPAATASVAPNDVGSLADRIGALSRSAPRVTVHHQPKITSRKFMTAPLNLWPAPRAKGQPLAVLGKGGKVPLTGVRSHGFAQILHDGQLRWVTSAYLADRMPKLAPRPAAPHPAAAGTRVAPRPAAPRPAATGTSAGVTSAPCPDGSATESGLTPSAVTLFRSVCNAFPALGTYGGYAARGEHSSGKAVDFMVSDPSLGQAVADWARAHAGELNLYDVIWQQHIWTPVRAAEGWRAMPDRGSPTANHYDHVHISVI